MQEEALGDGDAGTAVTYSMIGGAYEALDMLDQARVNYEQVACPRLWMVGLMLCEVAVK